MTTYFKNTVTGELLQDPIESNHSNLKEITEQEFSDARELKNNPPKTYSQELAALNADKRAKEKDFAEKFALILGRNGASEDPAKIGIRNSLLAKIDTDYAIAKAALNLKYYGE